MSTAATTNTVAPSKLKAKKFKDKEKAKDRERKEKPQLPGERLKIVVRRLPPNLPEDIFWQSVSSWVIDDSVSWKAYYPGKPKKSANKENVSSRAYIAFKTPEQLLNFSRDYDGHKFIDKAGNESYAIVEYAPYQKVPGEKKKPDSRNATIEKDEDYISFLATLNAPVNTEPVTIEALVASIRPASPPKTTPLLEALKVEKQAQKDKEAIIRNHHHYKDLIKGPPTGILRKDDKRKGARVEATQGAGKKGKKAAVPPSPAKTVQIQTNPSSSAHNGNVGNAVPTAPVKPQQSPSRSSRKHSAKPPKSTVPAAAPPPTAGRATSPRDTPAVPAAPVTAAKASASTQPQTTDGAPNVAPPARRGRPVLGLGLRQFEAALSGAGVAGGRKRGEKGKETTPVTPVPPQENTSRENPIPPTSPKRSRHRKEGSVPTAVAGPDTNSINAIAAPGVNGGASSPPNQTTGTRGGKRHRGGGRGRGGPPRTE